MAYHNQHLSQELPPIHHFTDQTNNNTFRSILPEDSPDDPNSKPDSDPNQLQTTPNWLNNALLRSTHYTDNNNNHNEVNNDVNGNGNGNDASNFLNLQTATDSAAVQTSGQWLSRSILHRHHGEVIDDVSAAVTGRDSVHELGDLKGEHLGGKGETVVGDGGGGLVNWPGEVIPELQPYAGPTTVIDVPSRLLMGPGPANSHPRVLAAQSLPLLGHMHPPFFKIMDEIQAGLQYVFQTSSKYTLLVSGTGHAGMEATIANLVEPGETVVVGNKGIWGARVCDMAGRFGAQVVNLEKEAGKAFSFEELSAAVTQHKPAVLFLCQGESSSGVHQNLAGLGKLCRDNGTLLLVDTVCSLGGVPLYADEWGIDAIYSGSQKCLAAPPGGAPLFLSQRALDKLKSRQSKVRSYNLDLNLIGDYWGWFGSRSYHHTGMVSMWYAMREALVLVGEEGLDSMWARHKRLHDDLWVGLHELGLEPFVENPDERLVTVNTIKVPEGVDWAALVKNAMDTYSVEIAGGLGPTVGKVWRVGIMGYNAQPQNVELVLASFRDGLKKQGRLP